MPLVTQQLNTGFTLNDYQNEAYDFAAYGSACMYPFTALSEECGEVSGKIAKYMRKKQAVRPDFQGDGSMEQTLNLDLQKELGDVLWQLSACCVELGVSLEEVAIMNLEKLGGRRERGTIVGSGDER